MKQIGINSGKSIVCDAIDYSMLSFIGYVSNNDEDKSEMDIRSPYTSIRRTKNLITVR